MGEEAGGMAGEGVVKRWMNGVIAISALGDPHLLSLNV